MRTLRILFSRNLTLRQKFVIWAEGSKRFRAWWIDFMVRRDMRLARTEFDKVTGDGLGPVYDQEGRQIGGVTRQPPTVYNDLP